jgi:hypothetical protein
MRSTPKDKAYRDKLRAAARHLRCDASELAIIEECRRQADDRCDAVDSELTPAERLDVLADHCSVAFEIVRSDRELDEAVKRHADAGDLGFLASRPRFDGNLLAAILRRKAPPEGSRTFVALVDARRAKEAKSFFSQAHEVAHPILEPQLAFDFREETTDRDAWEALVDAVGSEMVFSGEPWELAVRQAFGHAEGATMRQFSELHDAMAPTASLTAVALAAANQSKRAVLVVWAGPESSHRDPWPVLRVLSATPNMLAMRLETPHIHQKRRVPDSSPIARSHRFRIDQSGFEDLGDWLDSSGSALPARRVWTAARAASGGVLAIIDFGVNGAWP